MEDVNTERSSRLFQRESAADSCKYNWCADRVGNRVQYVPCAPICPTFTFTAVFLRRWLAISLCTDRVTGRESSQRVVMVIMATWYFGLFFLLFDRFTQLLPPFHLYDSFRFLSLQQTMCNIIIKTTITSSLDLVRVLLSVRHTYIH